MKRMLSVVVLCGVVLTAASYAADYVWTGAGKDGFWNTPSNWNPATGFPRSGDNVLFPEASTNVTVCLNGDQAVRSVTFNPVGAFSYMIVSNTLSFDDGGKIHFLKLAGNGAVQSINSDIKLAGSLMIGNENRWYLGGELLTIHGRLSGSGRLTFASENGGCVGLAGDNTGFTGPITIANSLLFAAHRAALGTGTQEVLMNGGAFWAAAVPTERNFMIASNASWSAVMSPSGPHAGTVTVVKGATWEFGTGGNSSALSGAIIGEGSLAWHGGHGTIVSGTAPNTLSGLYTIGGGVITLAKPAGMNAVSGPLVMNADATLRWGADEQIADRQPLKFTGDLAVLELNGHKETLGALDVQAHGFIEYETGSNVLHVADSRTLAWNEEKELVIRKWKGLKRGGGVDQIVFGNSPEALTAKQLAHVGFRNPAGYPAGIYTAAILKTGELVPAKPVQAINPPYDVSEKAKAERQKAYESAGRVNLSGKSTPLKNAMKIAFFGDSITWGGGYIGVIAQALKAGEGTKDFEIKLINHGVNGGGALTLRDGDDTPGGSKSHAGGTKPRPFAEYLAEDKPEVAVIYIGINDIWWRKTTPADFEKALSDMVATAKANKAVPVLATLAVWGDSPLPDNVNNARCDEYAAITRKVAADTGTTLVDLRKACFAYLQNNNPELRLDGSLRFSQKGILTGDGVHLHCKGGELVADMISQGIVEALLGAGRH